MSIKSTCARKEAEGKPCVVIDRDANGNDVVYADPGVVVFSRSAHLHDDPLYRYTPTGIPEDWLTRGAGFRGDKSDAEARALALGAAMLLAEAGEIERTDEDPIR